MDMVLAGVALLAGFILLELGADRVTAAASAVARRLRASVGTVGLLTAGGEWEELAVVVLALAGGHRALAAGNIIGSCIANLTGSMPLGLLGSRPLVLDRSARVYALILLGVTAMASLFLVGGSLEPVHGGILIAMFLVYVASVLYVIRRGLLRPPHDDEARDDGWTEGAEGGMLRSFASLVGGLLALVVGAELAVGGAVHIAQRAGLSEYAIGATIVAIGTTLPDKAISLVAGLRGRGGVVTANAIGSNIFLLTLVLGISSLFSKRGLTVATAVTHVEIPILLAVTGLVAVLVQRRTLHRAAGSGLLGVYCAYLGYVLVRGG